MMGYLGSFHARIWNQKHYFCFETAAGEIFSKKEEFIRCICTFKESFLLSPLGCYMMGLRKLDIEELLLKVVQSSVYRNG